MFDAHNYVGKIDDATYTPVGSHSCKRVPNIKVAKCINNKLIRSRFSTVTTFYLSHLKRLHLPGENKKKTSHLYRFITFTQSYLHSSLKHMDTFCIFSNKNE